MQIDYNNYKLNSKERLQFFCMGYVATFSICILFYHSLILAMISGCAVIFAEKSYKDYLGAKRRNLLLIQFKDLLYALSSSLATGRQMEEALREASKSLGYIYEQESPMVCELRRIVRSIDESGESEENVLVDLAGRSGLEDIRNFVDVYLACRMTGGNMESIISNAAQIIMEKMAIRREIKALTAQKELEGKIIMFMPIAVILGLNLFYPDYLAVMYVTLAGRIIMSVALLGIAMAYKMTLNLIKIEV